MANKFSTQIASKIIEAQLSYLLARMHQELEGKGTEQEIKAVIAETIQRYYVNLGRPLLMKRLAEEGHLPFIEEYSDTINEIVADMTILYTEIELVGDTLAEHFNYAQSEKLRLENRIKGVSSLINDLNLIANETTPNSVYIKDSFTDQSNIQDKMILGVPAQISTREGIVTLARTSTVNRSTAASIKLIQGDGEAGTVHIARRAENTVAEGQFGSNARYLFDSTPNNDPLAILDSRPDTIFEYQMVNTLPTNILDVAKNYDFAWARGQKANDRLRLRVVIELQGVLDINWININPYHPPQSTGRVAVYSIRTSEDGFDYKGLYSEGNYILNAELNSTPQTYRQDEVFDGSNDFTASKFAGQGVWSFGTRKAKYVEVVFDQVESYAELIGHTYYEKVTTTKDPVSGTVKETKLRVSASEVPENVVAGQSGKYTLSSTQYIYKGIEIFDGWRYAIGIRDINIMSYQFAPKSELITKKFYVDKPIKEVMLYANEKIPEAFLQDLRKANDWIQYFISFDDVEWYQLSAMHQSPVSGTTFPPKIIELNSTNITTQESFQLYKSYVTTTEDVKAIRLKIVLQRPDSGSDAASFTPILEDYSLRLVFKDGNV